MDNILVKEIENQNISILNDKKSTLLKKSGNRSPIIDLILVSSNLATICTVSTASDTWNSNHFPIHALVNGKKGLKKKFTYKWNINRQILTEFQLFCLKSPINREILSGIRGIDKYK